MAVQESWSPTLLRSTRDVADDVRLFELVPEDGIDRLPIVSALVEIGERILQAFEQLFTFDEERCFDFCHRVGHVALLIRQPC